MFVVGAAVTIATWAISENVRVNPIQRDLETEEKKVQELEKEIKEYKEQVELGNLVVYEETWHTVGDKFTVLEGQVAIRVESAYSSDNAAFVVDAPGYELQEITAGSSERATFDYNKKRYLINITDDNSDSLMEDNEIKLSISELND